MGALNTMPTSDQMPSPFFMLPGEIRNNIYELLIPRSITIRALDGSEPRSHQHTHYSHQNGTMYKNQPRPLDITTMLLVNRQMHDEALATLFRRTQLSLTVSDRMWATTEPRKGNFAGSAGKHLRNALAVIPQFDQVKISLCLEGSESDGYDTPRRAFQSLALLLAPLSEVPSKRRNVELHTCLHLWRGDIHWGGPPRRRDLDELFRVVEAHKEHVRMFCMAPKPLGNIAWMRYNYGVNDQEVAMELAYFKERCDGADVSLTTTWLEAPPCIPGLPFCFVPDEIILV